MTLILTIAVKDLNENTCSISEDIDNQFLLTESLFFKVKYNLEKLKSEALSNFLDVAPNGPVTGHFTATSLDSMIQVLQKLKAVIDENPKLPFTVIKTVKGNEWEIKIRGTF